MIQGWEQFARQVIEGLQKFDREHHTEYAYFLSHPNGKPDGNAIDILAGIMRETDAKNQWEPVSGRKITVNELENILNSEDDTPIQILPDGSIREIRKSNG